MLSNVHFLLQPVLSQATLQLKQHISLCFRVMSEIHRIEKLEIYSDVFHP